MLQTIARTDMPPYRARKRKSLVHTEALNVLIDADVKQAFDIFCIQHRLHKALTVQGLVTLVMRDPDLLKRALDVVETPLDSEAE